MRYEVDSPAVSDERVAWLAVGVAPQHRVEELPLMPRVRHAVMAQYLPLRSPTALLMMKATASTQVALDFADALRSAAGRGYQARLPEYQQLRQRSAEMSLDTFEMVANLAAQDVEEVGLRTVVEVASYARTLLTLYLERKPAIAPQSRWFPRRARHKRWYTASNSETSSGVARHAASRRSRSAAAAARKIDAAVSAAVPPTVIDTAS